MRIVLLGAPGAGKGTQGAAIAEHLGVPYISTGEHLRAEAQQGTDLGRQVAPVLDRGDLVPDDLVVTAVGERLAAVGGAGGWVLDGFPRSVAQAERAGAMVEPDVVVYLRLDAAAARQRLAARASGGRRDDADPQVIARRLEVFHAETEPLLAYYRAQGLLRTVDATPPPDEVTEAIMAALPPST